jgi:ribonuclease P protein component
MATAARPQPPAGHDLPAPLPRAARLLKASEFTQVFKNNQASTDAFFRILWRPSDRAASRLGMAIARKVDRSAVGRNRIKRIVRESFRRWRAAQAGAERHYDVVVLARPPAAQAANAELAGALERHWRRIGRDRMADRRPRATEELN